MTTDDYCYGDHLWMGGGVCVRCGEQLRCYCGQFVTSDGLGKHLHENCPVVGKWRDEERRLIERTLAP